MAVPTKARIMIGLLKRVSDQQEFQLTDIIEALSDDFSLTDEDRIETADGGSKRFPTRCGWACTDLKNGGLLESARRGHYRITTLGLEAVRRNPGAINARFMEQLHNTVESSDIHQTFENSYTIDDNEGRTAEDSIEDNYQQIRKHLAAALLKQIKEKSPGFFEELVIDLLVKMGYGGSRDDAEVVGRSGDGGIDGVIKEDKLGLDVIYVQAKRWEQNIGDQPVRDFVGALGLRRARKGIFITTSRFSESARECVSEADSRDCKVVLIDGRQLAELMIEYNVGVSTVKTYEIKRVDSDYFIETDDSQTQDS